MLLSVLLMHFNYVFKYKVMIIKSNVSNFTFTSYFFESVPCYVRKLTFVLLMNLIKEKKDFNPLVMMHNFRNMYIFANHK